MGVGAVDAVAPDDVMGVIITLFSLVRSNKYLMYGLAALVLVGMLLILISRRDSRLRKEGAMTVALESAKAVIKSQERYREIHQEIKRLPMSERAAKLRATDRRED